MMSDDRPPGMWVGEAFRSVEEIKARAAAMSRGLNSLDTGPGRTLVLLARNSHLPIETALAAAGAGLRVVPVNPRITAPELDYVLTDSSARVLVGQADLIRPLREVIAGRITVLSQAAPPEVAASHGVPAAETAVEPGDLDLEDFLRDQPGTDEATAPPVEVSLGSIFYTSGTTGRPKGMVRAAPTLEEVAKRKAVLETCYGLERGARGLATTPLHHMFASGFTQTTLRLDGTVWVMPRFDAEEFLRLVHTHRITHAQVVPTMFVRLLALDRDVRERYNVSSLRHVLHTGAPCPAHVKRAMIDWWGPVIWEQYGTSETGVVALCDSAEWLAHPGTVGRPFLGSEIRIYDEAGRPCAPGEAGLVYARMHGTPDFTYLNRPEARREVERDGLVTGGDIGYLDGDGYLHLRDRRVDLILTGGTNVYPAEVEEQITAHPAVRDCAVVGAPDEDLGQRVTAFVVLVDGAPEDAVDQLSAHLRERLSSYKVPREIHVVPEIPRDESGKLLRRVVRELVTTKEPAR